MFDYYKINTLGLPQFQVDETYKRNYFCFSENVLLTIRRQITYLVDRFFTEPFSKDNNKKQTKGKHHQLNYKCSVGKCRRNWYRRNYEI
mgnify:FL=1